MLVIKFFVTPVYPYGNDHYYHEVIALAEGFEELGWEVKGNVNYWWQPEKGSYLIPDALEDQNYDLAVYDYRYVTSFAHLLFRKGYPNFDKNKKHILVDRNDWNQPIWWANIHYKVFDLILAGNLFSNMVYPKNIKPWAIGLSNRIIHAIDNSLNVKGQANREKVVGYNFRVDHNMRGHLLNSLKNKLHKYPAAERFTNKRVKGDMDAVYYEKSKQRHNPEYYQLLSSVEFFMAFGGYFDFKPLKYYPYTIFDKIVRKCFYWCYKINKALGRDFSNQIFIFQHDNFRFWEVMYSGSVAINIDLNYWNFCLPVMPVAGKHYLGIKRLNDNPESILSSMNTEEIRKMGVEGRNWVIEHYSPKAQAMRLLLYLNA